MCFGVKEGGDSVNEFLLLTQKEQKVWECLTKPGKRAKVGSRFVFGEGLMTGEVIEVLEDGNRIVRFECEDEFFSVLDRIGQMPLPPYITEKLEDKERYQTVYSRELGSAGQRFRRPCRQSSTGRCCGSLRERRWQAPR